MRVALLLLAAAAQGRCAAAPDDVLLFSFFRGNGEDGLYLAASDDGLSWRVLNGNRPLLRPEVGESKLMRDPSIARAPDGTFHMVWTTSWKGRTIGHATSKDLVHWSGQRAIAVMEGEPSTVNCWAPEIFWDDRAGEFLVVWASTVPGKFTSTEAGGEKGYNHRLYSIRTKDFASVSPTRLFWDPGFSVIDAALVRLGDGYAMVAKNETAQPPAKYLFTALAPAADGPWRISGERITGKEWSEGPAPVRWGDAWYVYFDLYRTHRYGALRSSDFRTWEDVTDRLRFPEGARHGTAFRAPRRLLRALEPSGPAR